MVVWGRGSFYIPPPGEQVAWVDMWKGTFNGAVSSISRASDGSVYIGTQLPLA
eukprot:COSAG01_NODE_3088_length_6602_cov_4.258804_3_plen_53_part_00